MNETLKKARELLADVTPLKTDCGKVCGARCCRPLETEETGMLLFPGEEELCERNDRPLACRIFPLLPVIRNDEVKVAADQRARAVCPLLRQGIRGMDPVFADAVREAGRLLAGDPVQRKFMEMLTEEQDELKSLREKLGGIG